MGERGDTNTDALLTEVHKNYLPNRVLLGASHGDDADNGLPLLVERQQIDAKATAYVCENYVCQLPVTEPQALARQLVD